MLRLQKFPQVCVVPEVEKQSPLRVAGEAWVAVRGAMLSSAKELELAQEPGAELPGG